MILFVTMCVWVCAQAHARFSACLCVSLCEYVHLSVGTCGDQKSGIPRVGVTGSYVLLDWCWEPSSDPSRELSTLLITASSLHPQAPAS